MISSMFVELFSFYIITVICSRVLGLYSSSCCLTLLFSVQFISVLNRSVNVMWHRFLSSVDVGSVFIIHPDKLLFIFCSVIRCQCPKFLSPLKKGNKYTPFGLWRTFGDPNRFDMPVHVVLYSLQYVVTLISDM